MEDRVNRAGTGCSNDEEGALIEGLALKGDGDVDSI